MASNAVAKPIQYNRSTGQYKPWPGMVYNFTFPVELLTWIHCTLLLQQFSNISALASLIDLSSISVFPPELQQGLQAFNNTALSISNIDFNGFNQQLNMSIINFDLNGAIQNLTSLTTAFQMANEVCT